jgi:hypothetical protein
MSKPNLTLVTEDQDMWIMVFDHPDLPSVNYYESEMDALEEAEELIEELTQGNLDGSSGANSVQVMVAQISFRSEFKTNF